MAQKFREGDGISISREGAYAVHGYTHIGFSQQLNNRLLSGSRLTENEVRQARAITSGLNELPVYKGPVVYKTNHDLVDYSPGKVFVETRFRDAVPAGESSYSSWNQSNQVEIHVDSRSGRNIGGLSRFPEGNRIVFSPGTQLRILSKTETFDIGSQGHRISKTVIKAIELQPGDSGYLQGKHLQQQINEQRFNSRMNEIKAVRFSSADLTKALNSQIPRGPHSDVAVTSFDKPRNGWGQLNKSTPQVPVKAIHKETADSPQQQVLFIRENFPELKIVNPKFYDPEEIIPSKEDGINDPYQKSHKINCSRCVVAFEKQLRGDTNAVAEGISATDYHYQDWINKNLDEKGKPPLFWETPEHQDFTDIILRFQEEPLGTRGIVLWETEKFCHVINVVATPHGVAFIDPQHNRLARIPKDPLILLEFLITYRPPVKRKLLIPGR